MAFIPAASGVVDEDWEPPKTPQSDSGHVAWCRFAKSHEKPTRIVLCDSDAEGAFRVYRHPSNIIGPIEGLNFMSLNMTDAQLQVIQRAIVAASVESVECALADICCDWLDARSKTMPRPSNGHPPAEYRCGICGGTVRYDGTKPDPTCWPLGKNNRKPL